MLLALNHGMQYGAKRTVITASGNVTASLIQASVSLAGLGAILIASEMLFLLIKLIGALYLIFMGIQTFRSSHLVDNSTIENEDSLKPYHKMFFESFLVAMGNPKAILFFSALFPQFINIESFALSELFAAMVTLAAVAFICFMIYAIGGERIISLFNKGSIGRMINKVIGTTFVGSGLAIILKR